MAGNSSKTAPGRPFEPGKSGNPSGRPKTDEKVKKALKAASLDAARTLVSLLKSENEKVRMQAATTILDRVYGKPTQSVEVDQVEPVRLVLGDDVKEFLV